MATSKELKEFIDQTRIVLAKKYPNFANHNPNEKLVLTMAYFCDVLKVREDLGPNKGKYVNLMLRSAGLDPGYYWCAAGLNLAASIGECWAPKQKKASVLFGWVSSALASRRLIPTKMLERGDIVYKQYNKTSGHIGVVVKVVGPFIHTIEANTSSGEDGSQNNGDGIYRRTRLRLWWNGGINTGPAQTS